MLEQQLERLNANIERLITVFSNGTAAAVATTPVPTPTGAETTSPSQPLSVHDVQAALVALASKTGRGPAAEILAAFGVTRVGQLAEKDFPAVMAKIAEASKQEVAAKGASTEVAGK